jgi:hypothetical protein
MPTTPKIKRCNPLQHDFDEVFYAFGCAPWEDEIDPLEDCP